MGKTPTRRVGYGGFHPEMAKLADNSVEFPRKNWFVVCIHGIKKKLLIAEN
jgi:hypothetical protein